MRLDSGELERMADILEVSGRYRIVRRLESRWVYNFPDGTTVHRGVFLDTETTGLDAAHDEIIELGMVPFDFSSDGRIFAVGESFSGSRSGPTGAHHRHDDWDHPRDGRRPIL